MTNPENRIATTRATPADLDALAPLFDAYRVFYRQTADLATARAFLLERLQRDESVIILARYRDGRDTLGFTQLYPAFSSVSVRRIWILNDLFVAPEARQLGVARSLMEAARAFASATGALRLVLETAEDNLPAQELYEALGYARETGTRHYSLELA